MSATIYKLPAADDYAWAEDLVCTVESRLGELHQGLSAPFDGDEETQAEPVTLDYVGRVFLFTRFLRGYADGFTEWAEKLEGAAVELRQIQEEYDDLLPDKEPIEDYWRRYARQWGEAAADAAKLLENREQREGGDAR